MDKLFKAIVILIIIQGCSSLKFGENCKMFTSDFLDKNAVFPLSNGNLNTYINENIKLPIDFDGFLTYNISFIVTCKGDIVDIHIEKNNEYCEECFNNLEKLLYEMPDWLPAEKNGEKVSSKIVLTAKIKAL